jgi:ammonia channel protein AmtB
MTIAIVLTISKEQICITISNITLKLIPKTHQHFFVAALFRTGAGLVSITAPCGNVESFSAFFIAIIGALVYQGWWRQVARVARLFLVGSWLLRYEIR